MGQSWSRTYPCYGYGGWLWRIKFDLVARGLTSKEKCLFLIMSCLAAKLCLTLCNPMDCSLTDSSVHGILQATILEWVAIFSSRESSWPRDLSQDPLNCRWILYCLSHQGSPKFVQFVIAAIENSYTLPKQSYSLMCCRRQAILGSQVKNAQTITMQ